MNIILLLEFATMESVRYILIECPSQSKLEEHQDAIYSEASLIRTPLIRTHV